MKNHLILKFIALILLAILCFNCEIWANNDSNTDKTKAEIDTLIEERGSTVPDWWDSVELRIPETLDMNWPVRTGFQQWGMGFGGGGGRGQFGGRSGRGGFGGRGGRGGFGNWGERNTFGMLWGTGLSQDNSRSIDNYLIQVVYPNAPRYKNGIKLVNHLMILHKDDTQKLTRSLNTLGDMFYDLLEDYARAAFWWQKSAKMNGSIDSLKLARCYYELGSKSAAYELLSRANSGYRSSNKEAIKFWANLGEVDKALGMIESGSQQNTGGWNPGFGRGSYQGIDYMFAAEICRTAGRYEQAVEYYEKVIASMSNNYISFRGRGREGNSAGRANANMEVVKILNELDIKQVPDGTYTSSAIGYGGTLYVRVSVARGRIMSVEVTQHWETYSYFARAMKTARKIVSKQGFKGVDTVSGATITSDAIINAAARALANAIE